MTPTHQTRQNHQPNYKIDHTFTERQLESSKIRKKYPHRIPVIVNPAKIKTQSHSAYNPYGNNNNNGRSHNSNNGSPEITQHKFLVQDDLCLAQFYYSVRKKIKIRSDQALFFFCEGQIPSSNSTLGELYKEFGDLDGFLYLTYSDEETFG